EPWSTVLRALVVTAGGISGMHAVIDLANHFGHNWRMDKVDHVMLGNWPHLLTGSAPSWSYLMSNAFPNAGNVAWMLPLIGLVVVLDWIYWRRGGGEQEMRSGLQ